MFPLHSGCFWIECTRGLDITEIFESFHIGDLSEQIVSRYYVGEAKSKRLSPFTFHENGFYKTLKRKVLYMYVSEVFFFPNFNLDPTGY